MALPPEPLEEVLPNATWIVDAEVAQVVSEGPEQQQAKAEPGKTSVGNKQKSQVLKLIVNRVLRGEQVKEIVVSKPVSAYLLRAGNKGPFLLSSSKPHPEILGRYGPDTYSFEKLERALKK